jgi:DNA-binding NtrC family response regulator
MTARLARTVWQPPPPILGRSVAITRAVTGLERFARSGLPVLLVGPTGTGKELFARHLHWMSGREGELVDVNCGALPREMVESLLFGHLRGAFTGAIQDTVGLVARANNGTLFLDELTSLPVEGQAALLRLLDTGEVRRVGDIGKRAVDFRVVSAVQDDIFSRIERGQFRRDLFHRVEGAAIHLPSLQERPEDIELLALHFAATTGRTLAREGVRVLETHSWPGNVRQLRAVIERAGLLSDGAELEPAAVREAIGFSVGDSPSRAIPAKDTPRATREVLLEVCAECDHDPVRIAFALGISRATLYRRLRDHAISLKRVSKSHAAVRSAETVSSTKGKTIS